MVRARPSSKPVRARQPVSRSVLSVEPMWRSTCPGRSGVCTFSERGFPSPSSTMSAMSQTEMSTPVATFSTSPATSSMSAAMIASIASASSST